MRDSDDLDLVVRQQPIDKRVRVAACEDKATCVGSPRGPTARGLEHRADGVIELEQKAPGGEWTALGVPVASCKSVFNAGGMPPGFIRSH